MPIISTGSLLGFSANSAAQFATFDSTDQSMNWIELSMNWSEHLEQNILNFLNILNILDILNHLNQLIRASWTEWLQLVNFSDWESLRVVLIGSVEVTTNEWPIFMGRQKKTEKEVLKLGKQGIMPKFQSQNRHFLLVVQT